MERSTEAVVDVGAKPAKVALASKIALRTSVRSLPSDASKAIDFPKGASRTYLSTVSEPHLPWSCILQTSIPLDARKMAPVTRNEWPVNLAAPVRVCNGRPRLIAKLRIVWTIAFLVATVLPQWEAGNNGEAFEGEESDETQWT